MITLGLVEAVDADGVYVTMPGSKGVLRGPYRCLAPSAPRQRVLLLQTDEGEQVAAAPLDGDGEISVRSFGARGDGVTDDTSAVTLAIQGASAVGLPLVFPQVPGGTAFTTVGYKVTSPLSVPGNIDVIMHGQVVYHGTAGTTALTINSDLDPAFHRRYLLRVRRGSQSTWSDADDIGIVIRNVQRSTITIAQADYFTIGARMFSDGTAGCVYNTVFMEGIYCNKVGLDLYSDDAGWVNENIFIGGTFSVESSTNLSVTRHAIRLWSGDGYRQNANVFHKPSFEIGANITGGAEAIPILINDGVYNCFHDVRDEGNSTTLIRTTDDSCLNYVSTTYMNMHEGLTDDQGAFPSSVVQPLRYQPYRAEKTVLSAPALHKAAVPYDGSTTNLPGFFFGTGGSASMDRNTNQVTINADYLELDARCLGVLVDTRQVKRFVVDIGALAGYGGRLVVRCYDSSGTVLDPASYPGDLIKGLEGASLYATTDFGKAYVTGTDNTLGTPIYFAVTDDDVDHVAVMAASGTATLRIRSFAIRTDQVIGQTAAWTPFPENAVLPVATQAPASGTWNAGQVVYHGAPSSGNPMGWVCTTGGSPGTWKALANVS